MDKHSLVSILERLSIEDAYNLYLSKEFEREIKTYFPNFEEIYRHEGEPIEIVENPHWHTMPHSLLNSIPIVYGKLSSGLYYKCNKSTAAYPCVLIHRGENLTSLCLNLDERFAYSRFPMSRAYPYKVRTSGHYLEIENPNIVDLLEGRVDEIDVGNVTYYKNINIYTKEFTFTHLENPNYISRLITLGYCVNITMDLSIETIITFMHSTTMMYIRNEDDIVNSEKIKHFSERCNVIEMVNCLHKLMVGKEELSSSRVIEIYGNDENRLRDIVYRNICINILSTFDLCVNEFLDYEDLCPELYFSVISVICGDYIICKDGSTTLNVSPTQPTGKALDVYNNLRRLEWFEEKEEEDHPLDIY